MKDSDYTEAPHCGLFSGNPAKYLRDVFGPNWSVDDVVKYDRHYEIGYLVRLRSQDGCSLLRFAARAEPGVSSNAKPFGGTEWNLAIARDTTKLCESGWVVKGMITIYGLTGCSYFKIRSFYARKGPVKIELYYDYGRRPEFRIKCKHPNAKSFQLLNIVYDIDKAIVVGEACTEIAAGVFSLPAPNGWVPEYKETVSKRVYDCTGVQRHKRIERCCFIKSATVIMLAQLNTDRCFDADIANPKCDNIWYIMDIKAFSHHSVMIAFNGEGWFNVSGIRHLRLAQDQRSWRFSDADKATLTRACKG